MGSADSAAFPILPTVDQPEALINIPRKAKYLISPEQTTPGAHTLPPAPIPESRLGPDRLEGWSHDQDDIGYDGVQDPNPIEGLPPLDPVEVQDTIQPNMMLKGRYRKPATVLHPREYGAKNIRTSQRYARVANAVNNSIWKS